MANERIYNFSAGPSMLPEAALRTAASEMLNFGGSGMSVMEMSHRSKVYQGIFDDTKAKLKALMNVPDTHEILFLQGGASLQFSMIPMNLMGENGKADYAVTGNFSNTATKEAAKYGEVNIAASSADRNHTYIPQQNELKLSEDAKYFYYCANNTIYGTEWNYIPQTNSPLVCDMSSNILSKPVDVSKYGIIYAGAQKNMAPAGLTVVIIDKSLAGNELSYTPLMMSYKRMIDKDSMFNTPPCYNIYMLGLVLDWVNSQGGLTAMEALRDKRSGMLYEYLDESKMFYGCAEKEARSGMNVTFRAKDAEIEADFVKEAAASGFVNLKGHRSVGGMRASIYNAMPVEGVEKLIAFMKNYEVKHNV